MKPPPGEPLIWVLILSELAVFGAGLVAFMAVRLGDPAGFAEAQAHLHRLAAGVNTLVLVTSGWLVAQAAKGARAWPRLAAAIALGAVFLALKGAEFADLMAKGISTETHAFFTFSYLLTGFHAAHVLAGMVLLGVACLQPRALEPAGAFWHMVDLVWVLLFPVVYLL